MKRVIVLSTLLLFCSCKKDVEFQSCANFEKIKGEWISIDGDTKNLIIINPDGSIERNPGIERASKVYYSSCSYKQKYNQNDYYFLFETNESHDYFDMNLTFDTITTATGAYDHTNENELIYNARFVKVK